MTMLSDVALPQPDVLDSSMAYREAGSAGQPVALFLHGNPTSSDIWRNVISLDGGRCFGAAVVEADSWRRQ